MRNAAVLFLSVGLAAFATSAGARPNELRDGFALSGLSGTALYHLEGTQVETRVETLARRFTLNAATKASPSAYWGVRVTNRFETEGAYKILDKVVVGASLGYRAYHPGFLVKSEWYEAGFSESFDGRNGPLQRAAIWHAAYFPSADAAVSIIVRRALTTSVTTCAQGAFDGMIIDASVLRDDRKYLEKFMVYTTLPDGWRPGFGLAYADALGVIAALSKRFP